MNKLTIYPTVLMKYFGITIIAIFSLLLPRDVFATHIVGGEIKVTCLGVGAGTPQYEILVKVRRDCELGDPEAQFDRQITVGMFSSLGTPIAPQVNVGEGPSNGGIRLNFIADDTLNQTLTTGCDVFGNPVCVHETTYRGVFSLTASQRASGVHFTYQRCCRNSSLTNVLNPLNSGMNLHKFMSSEELNTCNKAPVLPDFPPIYACQNQQFSVPQGGIDADGDILQYRLYTPLTALDSANPITVAPDGPPYLDRTTWQAGYDLNDLFNPGIGADPLTIDPNTGLLSGTPTLVGQFLIGVCIEEIRDDRVFATTCREFEVNVRPCGEVADACFTAPSPLCDATELTIENCSSADDLTWYFDWPNLTPSSTANTPTVTHDFGTSGVYEVVAIAKVDGSDCVDTARQTIEVIADNGGGASYEIATTSCIDSLVVVLTDNSTTGVSNIAVINWTVTTFAGVLTGTGDNFTFNLYAGEVVTISHAVTYENGCVLENVDEVPFELLVKPLPDTLVACTGNTETISLSGPNTLTWVPNFLIADIRDMGRTVDLYSDTITTSWLFYTTTNPYGCSRMDSIFIDVQQTINIDFDVMFECDSRTVTFINNSDNVDLTWYFGDDSTSTERNPVHTYLEDGVYTVSLSASNGKCDPDAVKDIDIRIEDFSLENDTIHSCKGASAILNPRGAISSETYAWSPADLLKDSNSATGETVNLTDNTMFYVTITNVRGDVSCVTYDSVLVIPDMELTDVGELADSLTVCPGQSISLYPNANVNYSYQWSPDTDLVTATSPNPTATPSSSIKYYVTITDVTSGCEATDSVYVTVDINAVDVNITPGDTTLCERETLLLNANTDDDVEVTWTNNGEVIGTGNPISVTVLEGENNIVAIGMKDGCEGQDEILVTGLPLPDFTLSSYNPDGRELTCEPDTMKVIVVSNTGLDYTYQWSGASIIGAIDNDTLCVFVEGPQDYSVTVTDPNTGCSETGEITVDLMQPSVTIVWLDASGTNPINVACFGDEVTAVANVTPPGLDYTYTWFVDGQIVGGNGKDTIKYIANSSHLDSVYVTAEGGCMDLATFQTNVRNLNDLISAGSDRDCDGADSVINLSVQGGDPSWTYNWSGPGLSATNVQNPVAIVTDSDSLTYTVDVTDELGCMTTLTVGVSPCEMRDCEFPYVFVPNIFSPNGDNKNDRLAVRGKDIDKMTFIVYTRWGEEVFRTNQQSEEWDGTYKGDDLEPDVYGWYLKVRCDNGDEYETQGNVTLAR